MENSSLEKSRDENSNVQTCTLNNPNAMIPILKNRALVTAYDSKYFKACLTFVTSFYKYSEDVIDIIYIFDLGLNETESNF